MRTAEFRLEGYDGNTLLHGFQHDHNEWNLSGPKLSGVCIYADNNSVINAIANEIYDQQRSTFILNEIGLRTDFRPPIYVDAMGGTTQNGRYQSFAEWTRNVFYGLKYESPKPMESSPFARKDPSYPYGA